ncbi:MAG: DNRLRE domain-containing protein, partial [bacterium]
MTDEMKIVAKGTLCCLIIAALFVSCSESITNPATPGSGLFTRTVLIKTDTIYASTDTTFLQRIAPDAILFSPLSANWVGKDGNYSAYTALRFYPPARDTINVLSAKLTLRLVKWRGDSSGTFSFTVHKILNTWEQTALKWPIVDSTGFYEVAPRGAAYSSTIGPDTQKITINLDTAMVREWYRTGVASYGFLLKPAAGCTIMRGIHSFDFDSTGYWPSLEVVARGTSTSAPDTTTFQVGADTYVAEASPFNLPTDHLFTQAGIAYRSKLKFD